ncbi:MAG: YnbE family lipoprotein [Gammaproteobacteria bacterium]|nr:YnbE family lipoprotein [Gammaproteobacteria bacterium]
MFQSPILPSVLLLTITTYGIMGCSPTVKVAPSDKPITINLNVKIEHEIRVKVDKELDELISNESGIF